MKRYVCLGVGLMVCTIFDFSHAMNMNNGFMSPADKRQYAKAAARLTNDFSCGRNNGRPSTLTESFVCKDLNYCVRGDLASCKMVQTYLSVLHGDKRRLQEVDTLIMIIRKYDMHTTGD